MKIETTAKTTLLYQKAGQLQWLFTAASLVKQLEEIPATMAPCGHGEFDKMEVWCHTASYLQKSAHKALPFFLNDTNA